MARPINIVPGPGRPSGYTRALAVEIVTRMHEGESVARIAQSEHMPHESTIRYWVTCGRHPEFTEAFRAAQKAQADRLFGECLEIADGTVGAKAVHEIYSAQLRTNVRKYMAGRLNPEAYGDRPPSSPSGGAHVTIYLPGKGGKPDSAKVIEGQAKRIEDDRNEPGTD
jgi:hypothetical protein